MREQNVLSKNKSSFVLSARQPAVTILSLRMIVEVDQRLSRRDMLTAATAGLREDFLKRVRLETWAPCRRQRLLE